LIRKVGVPIERNCKAHKVALNGLHKRNLLGFYLKDSEATTYNSQPCAAVPDCLSAVESLTVECCGPHWTSLQKFRTSEAPANLKKQPVKCKAYVVAKQRVFKLSLKFIIFEFYK
jgi:hypothetical protein